MSDYTQAALAWLRGITPELPAALLIVFVLTVIYSIRRWKPAWWLKVEATVPFVDTLDPGPGFKVLWAAWQAWPAVALGTATAALMAGASVRHALWGALCGAISAATHIFMANYKGQVGALKRPPPPSAPYTPERSVQFPRDAKLPSILPSKPPPETAMVGLLVSMMLAVSAITAGLVLCIAVSGCTWLEKTAWPIAKDCAPSEASLISQVATILLAGGDIEAKLGALAVQIGVDGKLIVECAVQQFIDSSGASTADEAAAKARGRAFLIKVHQ